MCVPGISFGVGEDSQKELHLDAWRPHARNDEVETGCDLVLFYHFRRVAEFTADLTLNELTEVSRIHSAARGIRPQLQRRDKCKVSSV